MPTYSINFLSPNSGPLRQGHYFIIIRILRLFSSAAIYYVAWFGMRRKYSPATILENKPRSEKQIEELKNDEMGNYGASSLKITQLRFCEGEFNSIPSFCANSPRGCIVGIKRG